MAEKGRISMLVALRRLLFALLCLTGLLVSRPAEAATVAVYGSPSTTTWNADVQAKIASTGLFTQVDAFFISSSTPSLAELLQYDAVLVYSDEGFADGTAMGNVLGDYLEAGKGVVLCAFAYDSSNIWGIKGKIVTQGYLPFTLASFGYPGGLSLVKDMPAHPILANVTSFSGGSSSYLNTSISLTAGSTLVAHWSNGQPLVATKVTGAGRVVGLNFFPPSSSMRNDLWDANTDGRWLMASALQWTVTCDADGDGFESVGCGGADCNDGSSASYPGALEVCDGLDNNCNGASDEGLFDTDGDGAGDACDLDDDNDGVDDGVDNCPLAMNQQQEDADGDALGDVCDPDDDNDAVLDATDNCPLGANPNQADQDGDGEGDVCDGDSDGDGLSNAVEVGLGMNPSAADSDGDSIGDGTEFGPGPDALNTDGDGKIDALDDDSDNDGALDSEEAGDNDLATEPVDTDKDNLPDYRDTDSDNDGVLDANDMCPLKPNPCDSGAGGGGMGGGGVGGGVGGSSGEGGSNGVGGSSGEGGSNGVGGSSGEGGSNNNNDDDDDGDRDVTSESGCGCEAAGAPARERSLSLALALFAAIAIARRGARRRSASSISSGRR